MAVSALAALRRAADVASLVLERREELLRLLFAESLELAEVLRDKHLPVLKPARVILTSVVTVVGRFAHAVVLKSDSDLLLDMCVRVIVVLLTQQVFVVISGFVCLRAERRRTRLANNVLT